MIGWATELLRDPGPSAHHFAEGFLFAQRSQNGVAFGMVQ